LAALKKPSPYNSNKQMNQYLKEFVLFGIKQAYACVYAGLLLTLVIVTHYYFPFEHIIYRYDFLFLAAILIQILLLLLKLETLKDTFIIFIFHIVATLMELFKTSDQIGAWQYPGDALLKIGNVPLFAGFMYSAVGSYLSRVWTVFKLKYKHFPNKYVLGAITLLIYLNFFTHHYIFDIRWLLIVAVIIVMHKTMVYFINDTEYRKMPMLLGLFLVALFIWFAENIATYCEIWFYPNQKEGWHLVSPQKLVAWVLFMLISYFLVALVKGTEPMDGGDENIF
jgi:uncharacterized membrane protein YoaT (DUF817 family)